MTNPDSDRGNLPIRTRLTGIPIHEDTGLPLDAFCLQVQLLQGANQTRLDLSQESVDIPLTSSIEIDDEIPHQLTRRVKGHIPPSRDFVEFHLTTDQFLPGYEKVLGPAAPAKRDHREVLKQEKAISSMPLTPRRQSLFLQTQAL